MRQVDLAEDDRRSRRSDVGLGRCRRRHPRRLPTAQAGRLDGPGGCAAPLAHRPGERGARPTGQPATGSTRSRPGRVARHSRARRLRRGLPGDAFRRDAATGEPRPDPRHRCRRLADGRAVRRPGRDDQGDARRRGPRPVAPVPPDGGVGHPSPPRGGEAGGSGRAAVPAPWIGDGRHRSGSRPPRDETEMPFQVVVRRARAVLRGLPEDEGAALRAVRAGRR